ncbi:MAG: hypothetical protein HY858_14230 [Candidatus Solibacter usitatus]|nr:hypothetical protein [Candidatus Solibacter usitatus]
MIPALEEQHARESLRALLVLAPDAAPVGQVIEDLILLDQCAVADDWVTGVIRLPLR